ncbi:MAG: NAD(P)H-dependent oxidoreductase [Candidatus Omnitrophica bacterium]|nr:NAD(P)H-dependent oxidoreductase [Candidatus Omnitrophota bacterium]
MKKLLHIIATPREDESQTLRVSNAFLEAFTPAHHDWTLEELHLFKEALPPLTIERVDGKYVLLSGKDLPGNLKEAWDDIIGHINKFLSADGYLITAPMWNFSIPYVLKHYLDIIVQPKYLFRYTANGVEGLVKNRKMVIVTSRGGDYRSAETRAFDHQEPYLKTIFTFVGVEDIAFVNSQPMDASGPQVRDQKIETACALARSLGEKF